MGQVARKLSRASLARRLLSLPSQPLARAPTRWRVGSVARRATFPRERRGLAVVRVSEANARGASHGFACERSWGGPSERRRPPFGGIEDGASIGQYEPDVDGAARLPHGQGDARAPLPTCSRY